jgi:hypothetical protein
MERQFEDPFVEEIHRTREELLEECGGDLDRLIDRLQAREREDSDRVVRNLNELEARSSARR